MHPLVSIASITYNHEKFIAQAIDSWLMQETNFEVEIVIGEDCSSDNTRKIIESFVDKYPDMVRLIISDKNVGMMPNFIRTLKACKGKYIALCEGDDYWTDPLKLQQQVDFLEMNEDYSICFHNANIIDAKNNIIELFNKSEILETTTIENLLINSWYIPTASMVFRQSELVIPRWFKKVKNGDFTIQLLLTCKGQKIYYINSLMSVYRKHAEGFSTIFNSSLVFYKSMILVYKKINKFSKKRYKLIINPILSYNYFQTLTSIQKNSFDFWINIYMYITYKEKISKSELYYLLRNIILSPFIIGFLRRNRLRVKKVLMKN